MAVQNSWKNGLVTNFDSYPNKYHNWVPHLGTNCFKLIRGKNVENFCDNEISVSEQVKERKNFRNKETKIFLNQSLCLYYRMIYGRVKELAKEGLTGSFWILNGTIKIKEYQKLSESKPVSITHLSNYSEFIIKIHASFQA